MTGKIGYLDEVPRCENEGAPHSGSQVVADSLPSLLYVYKAEAHSIPYAKRTLTSPLDPADVTVSRELLSPGRQPRRETSNRCSVRPLDRHGCQFDQTSMENSEDGDTSLILLTAKDILQDLKSKEEFETTRELLEETEELLQFGSWAWEISTNLVSWTPGLYALMEYSPKDVEGRIGLNFYLSHILEEYSQAFQEILSNALKEKADFTFEYVIRTGSGTLKNISTRGKIVKGEQGEVLKILCINRDITALRTFEKDQERNIRELNRSNRDLEEFAYIASHDLQEPLRKISMFTERLKAKYENSLDKEGGLFIERILASAANMRTLIDDLLNFSRANRRSHTFDQVNLKSVLEGVISELELKIEETQATITFHGELPTIQSVTSEMKQLFSNILSNAIKFRKPDSPVQIEVRSAKLSKTERQSLGLSPAVPFHRIEVQDNGIGFEPEYSERIFQIFQRLNGKSEYPGSGIGLAICKKIVEKHNGLIFAKSAPEKGATFTLILPEKQF